jgi:hypothetical protein
VQPVPVCAVLRAYERFQRDGRSLSCAACGRACQRPLASGP